MKKQVILGLFIVSLVFLTAIFGFQPTTLATTCPFCNYGDVGDWPIGPAPEHCTDQTLWMNGNITWDPGVSGNLTISNCTLYFNSTGNGQYGIFKQNSGGLIINYSTITVNPNSSGTIIFLASNGGIQNHDFIINNSVIRFAGFSSSIKEFNCW